MTGQILRLSSPDYLSAKAKGSRLLANASQSPLFGCCRVMPKNFRKDLLYEQIVDSMDAASQGVLDGQDGAVHQEL